MGQSRIYAMGTDAWRMWVEQKIMQISDTPVEIVQETGSSETAVMSQNAVTLIIGDIETILQSI